MSFLLLLIFFLKNFLVVTSRSQIKYQPHPNISHDCMKFNESGTDVLMRSVKRSHWQWRSEGAGGQLPPGASRRGAPKSCQRI